MQLIVQAPLFRNAEKSWFHTSDLRPVKLRSSDTATHLKTTYPLR